MTKFTKGGQWRLVTDLQGFPTHDAGGVDILVNKEGVFMAGNVRAERGMVIVGPGDPPAFDAKKYETQLSAQDEQAFQLWLDDNYKQGRIQKGDYSFYKKNGYGYDYDFRAAFKAGVNSEINEVDKNWHWSDIGKKPNHPTFSDQSKYNGVDGFRGGTWDGEKFIPANAGSGRLRKPAQIGTAGRLRARAEKGIVYSAAALTATPDTPPEDDKNPKTPVLTKQQYQEAIATNYEGYLKQHPYVSYPAEVPKGMNCINGVCHLISGTTGKDIKYTGNPVYLQNRDKEGYYIVDKPEEGFEVGDVLQYSRFKDSPLARFEGDISDKNAKELYPNHAQIIVGKKVKDGKTSYTIVDNQGEQAFRKQVLSEDDLKKRFKEGFSTFNGIILTRYDPEVVARNQAKANKFKNVVAGQNAYAEQYKNVNPVYFDDERYQNDPRVKNLEKIYNEIYQQVGKAADLPKDVLNQLIAKQIGIAGRESRLGDDLGIAIDNLKPAVPDFLLPIARQMAGSDDDWMQDYWNKNVNNIRDKYNSVYSFKLAQTADDFTPAEKKEYDRLHLPRSQGIFQQKELSPRGRALGADLETTKGQVLGSLSLAIDNFHTLQEKYPDMDVNSLVELTSLMHNAPSKALNPLYVDYYLKNKEIDYVNMVNFYAANALKEKAPPPPKKDESVKMTPKEKQATIDWVKQQTQETQTQKAPGSRIR